MKKRIIAAVLNAVLLVSCASAPEEVQRENSILDNAEKQQTSLISRSDASEGNESALEYLTLDEIRTRLESDLDSNNTNIVIKNVRIGEGYSMPVYDTVREYSDCKGRIGKAVSEIFRDNMTSNMKGSIVESDDDFKMLFYVPKGKTIDSGISASVYGSMGITYEFSDNNVMPAAYGQESIEKTYLFNYNEQTYDDSYIMADDKELKISDAASEAERLFNSYFIFGEGDSVSYKISRLDVYKSPNGKHGFVYYMDAYDKDGNILIGNLNPVIDIEAFDRQEILYPYTRTAYGYFTDSEMHPYAYTNFTPSEGSIKDTGDKLISLKSAVAILNNKLASSEVYDFDEAALAYIAVIPPTEGLVELDELGEKTIFDYLHYYMNSEAIMELRPFWIFRDSSKSTPEYSVWGGLFCVDALTGELYIF